MGRLPPDRAPGRSPRCDDERLLDWVLRLPVQSPNIDGETGAYTVRFRHYDPTPGVARWLERDPAGYVDGPSLYGYLGRSPVDGMDPWGLQQQRPGLYAHQNPNKAASDQYRKVAGPPPGGCADGKADVRPVGSGATDAEHLAVQQARHDKQRQRGVVEAAQTAGELVEAVVDVIPGAGGVVAVNDALEGNYAAAGTGILPADKLVGAAAAAGLGAILKKRADTAAKLARYDGPKPKYSVNSEHAPGTLRPGKTPLPADAESASYKRAVPDRATNPRHWYGRGDDGTIYRFSSGNDGTVHFSGADGVGDGIRSITPYAKQRLGNQ